jgi:hypothetical protein
MEKLQTENTGLDSDKGKFMIYIPLALICLLVASFAFQASDHSNVTANPKVEGFTEFYNNNI